MKDELLYWVFIVAPSVTDDTTTSVMMNLPPWQQQPSVPIEPSVVAGVDLSQLPPLQRQLFLRMHQQQQQQQIETTIETSLTAASQNSSLSQSTVPLVAPPGMLS